MDRWGIVGDRGGIVWVGGGSVGGLVGIFDVFPAVSVETVLCVL
jgi:hypothetical protein